MRCRTCGYSLWNLTSNRCPECGGQFDLCEYRFRPGTVAFVCLKCGHQHKSVALKSNVLKGAMICRGCGGMVPLANVRVSPLTVDPRDADASPVEPLPWEDRESQGLLRSYWRTLCMMLFAPRRCVDHLGYDSPWIEGYVFAVGTYLLTFMMGGLVFLLASTMEAAISSSGGPMLEGGTLAGLWLLLLALSMVGVLVAYLLPAVMLGVVAIPAHFFLKCTGGAEGGLNATVRNVLYAQAGMVWLAGLPLALYAADLLSKPVPMLLALGAVLLPLGWTVALAGRLIAGSQRVSRWRAVTAGVWLVGPGVILLLLMA